MAFLTKQSRGLTDNKFSGYEVGPGSYSLNPSKQRLHVKAPFNTQAQKETLKIQIASDLPGPGQYDIQKPLVDS